MIKGIIHWSIDNRFFVILLTLMLVADEGDFEEVMRAYIAELNTKIELLQIDVARLRVISRLNYLLARSEPEKE